MSALVIEEPGPTATLQDGGRVGAARYGVPRSGPVDRLSHRLAALLAGAGADEVASVTALEVGPRPCTIAARGAVTVALAGSGAVLRTKQSGDVPAPCVVTLGPGERATVQTSTWAYLVPTGPIEVAPVLGSTSTHPRSGLGPHLAAGTVLALGAARAVREGAYPPPKDAGGPFAVLPGPQTTLFDEETRATLVSATFRTTPAVDRMGQRLDGPAIVAAGGHDIVSDGIVPGALQVPGDGRPYVLTADHQTTGGYPKIAVLTTASLARFVRTPPGVAVRFRWSTIEEARDELRAAVAAVATCVEAPVRPTAAQLATRNLVDGVTDGD